MESKFGLKRKTSKDFVQKYVENILNPKDVIMSAYYFKIFLKYKAILTACGLCVIKWELGSMDRQISDDSR